MYCFAVVAYCLKTILNVILLLPIWKLSRILTVSWKSLQRSGYTHRLVKIYLWVYLSECLQCSIILLGIFFFNTLLARNISSIHILSGEVSFPFGFLSFTPLPPPKKNKQNNNLKKILKIPQKNKDFQHFSLALILQGTTTGSPGLEFGIWI